MPGKLMKKTLLWIALCSWGLCFAGSAQTSVTLVADGQARMPIVVFADAPPFTRQAAVELADYIEKISGARPDVLEGRPDPLPASAVWVGYQPAVREVFPDQDFDFAHPEEILIAANARHLVIAGRDRWDARHMTETDRRGRVITGIQREYGTVNAVYTFLQDHLGVRWLWPGELGEDVPSRTTLAFAPFVYRYHPQFRGRHLVFMIYKLKTAFGGHEWARFQRLQLDSLDFEPGHVFAGWWDRYHAAHPDYFALQADGTRGGHGGKPKYYKLCKSNPAVWEQWLANVDESLQRNPNQQVFSANANDGWLSGYCVCDNCRAWDRPEGVMLHRFPSGREQEYQTMSDRQITFANTLARKLRERHPDRPDLMVAAFAYGLSRPPPVAAVPDENVLVAGVWNFFNQPNEQAREYMVRWSKITRNIVWRPNLSGAAGWVAGFPNVALRRVMQEMRFAAGHHVIGLAIDWIWGHWAGQGPHYYLLAQMAWNPYADGEAILADYHRRAFGPAAAAMADYWDAIEQAATRITYGHEPEGDVWDEAFFKAAYARLERARVEAATGADIYASRVAFVRAGLDYMRLMREMAPLVERMAETHGGHSAPEAAAAKAAAEARWASAWKAVKQIQKTFPFAVSREYVREDWRRLRKYNPRQFDAALNAKSAKRPVAQPPADVAVVEDAE